jgi:hypothetical protein
LIEGVAADGIGMAADRYGGTLEARIAERGAQLTQLRFCFGHDLCGVEFP